MGVHGHSHNHGSGGCGHGAAGQLGEEFGIQYSLYQRIDLSNLECLNETEEDSAKHIFIPWENRLQKEKCVESDADEELLINIPFTGNVKLKGIIIIGGEEDTHPDEVRLFKNRPKMTFDDASAEPDQKFSLVRDTDGTVEYKTKIVKFSSVHHLTLHFPSNFGDDKTKIYYIGLSGEWTKSDRVGVVHTVYETMPGIEDHKNDILDGVSQGAGPAF